MIYLLTAIGLSPGGSTHLHTNNRQNNTNNNRTTQITTKCGRVRAVPRLCEFYPGICLTTEEKARKTLSQGKKNLSQVKKNLEYSIHITKTPTHHKTLTNTHITKPTHTHAPTPTHTHTHILQNNIKPPQYKLKQNAHRKSNTMGRKNSTQFLMLLIHRYSTPFLTGPSLHFTALHCNFKTRGLSYDDNII